MTQIWLISDTHFSHANIIKYCGRPFANEHVMDEELIANWNGTVLPQDHVYHLGDVSIKRGGKQEQEKFISLIKRLNGHKRLILGNHDHFPINTYTEVFEKVVGTGQWLGNGLILSHYPIHPSSMGRAIANVHGHIHNNSSKDWNAFPPVVYDDGRKRPYINVSVEVIDYRPTSVEKVMERVKAISG